jgi:diaminopimelate epimerase
MTVHSIIKKMQIFQDISKHISRIKELSTKVTSAFGHNPYEGSFRFQKLQGTGNCLAVIFLDKKHIRDDLSDFAQKVCSAKYGLGTDGVMLVYNQAETDFDGQKNDSHFFVKMYNPDGSVSGMCGNGIRCVVRALYKESILEAETASVVFNFDGRVVLCSAKRRGCEVSVNMGKPSFDPKAIDLDSQNEHIQMYIPTGNEKDLRFIGSAVSMGNPHCVIIDSEQEPDMQKILSFPLKDEVLLQYGQQLEYSPMFKSKTNVEFLSIPDRKTILFHVWERGAGITLACGSGACAAFAVSHRNGYVDDKVKIVLPGGELVVEYTANKEIIMTGDAHEICSGDFCI